MWCVCILSSTARARPSRGHRREGLAGAACFIDSGVKRHVYLIGRTLTVVFSMLFVVAEVLELVT